MEMTTVTYTKPDGSKGRWDKSFVVVDGGVVLLMSEQSQVFVPYHRVIEITQTFSKMVERGERYNKSLATRMVKH